MASSLEINSTHLDLDTVKKRAIVGVVSLTLRRIALQAITFLSINIILARIYPPETGILGIFNLANAVIAFFAFFSDIGLAASLIQKKGDVTNEDLKTTFTIQQFLVGSIAIIIFLAAPQIASSYKLDASGMWLIRALGIAFLFSSLKVIPSVLLERELRFNPLVGVEIAETLIFNIILLSLAFLDFGIYSFTFAVLGRAFSGTILIYIIAPWRIRVGVSKSSIKSLLTFGLPYQLNTFLALLKDRIVPLFVAGVVGTVGLSYITWAQTIAFLPLEIMNIIIRVTFPAFSRLQENREELRKAVEKSLFATTLFLYPALFGMLALAPFLVEYIVKPKWQPALTSVYLFSFSTFWATLSTPFTNVFNAVGKIKLTFRLMVMWTALTWILTPILTIRYGFNGVAIASALISFTSIVTIYLVKKTVNISILANIWQPLVVSISMGIFVYVFSYFFVQNIPTFFLAIIVGAVFYFLVFMLLAKEKLLVEIRRVINGIQKS
jgi:O-antigen/teichoic acid export membrane protein